MSKIIGARRWFVPGLFFFVTSLTGFSQTFNVTAKTLGPESITNKDRSVELRFNVSMNGATLTNVIPEMVLPTCALQGGLSIFNATYLGWRNAAVTTPGPVPTWSSGQIRELVFNVHFYDNTTFCSSAATACPSGLDFKVRFTHSGQATPIQASDSAGILRFASPTVGGFQVIQKVSETADGICANYDHIFIDLPISYLGVTPSLLSDPTIKVFLGINWSLNINYPGSTLLPINGIIDFVFPLNSTQNYPLGARYHAGQVALIPFGTTIRDTSGNPFSLYPAFGGFGNSSGLPECPLQTWNFFDITAQLSAGGQVIKPIVGALNANNAIQMTRALTPINFRKAGLYLVRDSGCQPGSFVFGAPPTNFQFTDYHITDTNQVQVALSVPAAWKTAAASTQLGTNYTVEWYYRNQSTYTKAALPGGGATDAKSLTTSLQVPYNLPSDFSIEARIRHNSGHMVSVVSPKHNFTYQESAYSFENAESSPDIYFDPGETLVLPISFRNVTGSTISNVTLSMDLVSPAGAVAAFNGSPTERPDLRGSTTIFQGALINNQQVVVDLLTDLLCLDQVCGNVQGSYQISYTQNGLSTSFRKIFSVPSNCQFVSQTISSSPSWTAISCFGSSGQCATSNCTGVTLSCSSPPPGWTNLAGDWVGSNVTNEFFYTLQTPAYAVGTNSSIHMRHLCNFNATEAGGIVEYSTSNNGSTWSNWSDLILALDGSLYDRTFSSLVGTGLDNIIGLRQVFTGSSNVEQEFTRSVPAGIFNQNFVRFRFVFQTRVAGPSGEWRIYDFDYSGNFPQNDNLFGFPTNMVFSGCNPNIQLTPGVAGSYSYEFFVSKEDLIDNDPAFFATDGFWPNYPLPPADANYFARVTNNATGASRIVSFEIQVFSSVPPFINVLVDWNETTFTTPSDIDSNLKVDVNDLVLQINLDSCNQRNGF